MQVRRYKEASLLTDSSSNSNLFFSCSQFILLANKDQNSSGRTKLDRERLKLCMSEVVRSFEEEELSATCLLSL